MIPTLLALSSHQGITIQDQGRPGWKQLGVPASGAMDAESAEGANRLVGNPPEAAVLELLLGNIKLQALRDIIVAITGAPLDTSRPLWRSFRLSAGEELALGGARSGVWSYIAVEGGLLGPEYLGSKSANIRAGLGAFVKTGDRLMAGVPSSSPPISSRFIPPMLQPSFDDKTPLKIWKGPDWELLSAEARNVFLETEWQISSRSDRAGYRLEGPVLNDTQQILSAPIVLGTIQIPAGGMPIVIQRDGPTVGGYPRVAMLDPDCLSAFSRRAPGRGVRFNLAE